MSEKILVQHSSCEQLADMIERDIRQKALCAGMPYMTAAEVGRMLGVHPCTANRAMTLLVKKSVLARRKGIGSFISPKYQKNGSSAVKRVHVLMGLEECARSFPVDELLCELLACMPGVGVEFDVLQPGNASGHVERLLENGRANNDIAGLLLIVCPLAVQFLVRDSRLPAIVIGGVFPGANLPSFDIDQNEVGKLAAKYLLDRGHKRIAFLTDETWLPGDNLRLDGVQSALHEAENGSATLIIRSLNNNKAVLASEINMLLTMPNRPTGIICYDADYALATLGVAESLGLNVPKDIELVVNNDSSNVHLESAVSWLPQITSDISSHALTGQVCEMLKKRIDEDMMEYEHIVTGVRLIEPDAG